MALQKESSGVTMEHKGVDTKPSAKQLSKRSKRKTSTDTKVLITVQAISGLFDNF